MSLEMDYVPPPRKQLSPLSCALILLAFVIAMVAGFTWWDSRRIEVSSVAICDTSGNQAVTTAGTFDMSPRLRQQIRGFAAGQLVVIEVRGWKNDFFRTRKTIVGIKSTDGDTIFPWTCVR